MTRLHGGGGRKVAPGVTKRSRLTVVTDVQRERACVREEEAFFLDFSFIFFPSLMELDLPVDAHLNVSSDISSPLVKYGPFRRCPPHLRTFPPQ